MLTLQTEALGAPEGHAQVSTLRTAPESSPCAGGGRPLGWERQMRADGISKLLQCPHYVREANRTRHPKICLFGLCSVLNQSP